MEDLIPNTETYRLPSSAAAAAPSPAVREAPPVREPVRLILIGSTPGITLIIGVLHRLGFAEPRTWSKVQRDPNTGLPMRVLTKWIRYGR